MGGLARHEINKGPFFLSGEGICLLWHLWPENDHTEEFSLSPFPPPPSPQSPKLVERHLFFRGVI